MNRTFVKTGNALKFLTALQALERRGAGEACLMVVDGEPGLGKSAVIHWWAVQSGSVFLRAKQGWSPTWLMRELLQELNVAPEYSFERMYRQAIDHLGNRFAAAARDDDNFAVVIDEADHISRRPALLETLRDLSDFLELPFILVGMGRIRHNLTRFPQVASRVGQYVEFETATLDDVRSMMDGLCEAKVADDLVQFVHKVSGGKYREIKEAIAAIERFGLRNSKTVSLADMSGQVLLNDRRSGRPITVRAS